MLEIKMIWKLKSNTAIEGDSRDIARAIENPVSDREEWKLKMSLILDLIL